VRRHWKLALPKLVKPPSLPPLKTIPKQLPRRQASPTLTRVARLSRLRIQRPMRMRLRLRLQPRVLRPIRARMGRLLRKLRLRRRVMRHSTQGLMRPVRRGQPLELPLQQRPPAQSRRQPRRRSHKLRHLERKLRPKRSSLLKKLQRPSHS